MLFSGIKNHLLIRSKNEGATAITAAECIFWGKYLLLQTILLKFSSPLPQQPKNSTIHSEANKHRSSSVEC